MADHITDHQRDRAIGQWDGVKPVTSGSLLLPRDEVTCRDLYPWQYRQRGRQQRLLHRGHHTGRTRVPFIRPGCLLPRWPLVSHVGRGH